MTDTYTTQEVSAKTDLSIDTLRYYERIGLISDVARAPNGHRQYIEADVVWILFLKQLRATGMSIAQMKVFAALRRGGDQTIVDRRLMLEEHRQNLEDQIQLIEAFMHVIDAKIARHTQREQTLRQAVS